MEVKINCPQDNSLGKKELIQNIAKAHAILIKAKKKILEQILENYKKG